MEAKGRSEEIHRCVDFCTLTSTFHENLEQKGVLNEVKAKIRSEIFTALDAESTSRPKLSNENMIINEMIREYLEYNRYYNSSSVLVTETGQPSEPPFDREYLHRKFGVSSQARGARPGMPLLYELIFGLKPELAGDNDDTRGAATLNERE